MLDQESVLWCQIQSFIYHVNCLKNEHIDSYTPSCPPLPLNSLLKIKGCESENLGFQVLALSQSISETQGKSL